MIRKLSIVAGLVIFLCLFSLFPVISSAENSLNLSQPPTALPNVAHASRASTILSLTKYKCADCWAGYVDNVSGGGTSAISAKLLVPTANCSSNSAASTFLVGLDGFASSDFAYSEVYVVCAAGSANYGAEWYDSITKVAGFTPWTPAPGDVISLSVSESSGRFNFKLVDETKNASTIGHSKATGAGLTSAECVTSMVTGFAQANFTKVRFKGCDATIGGTKKGIGAFGSLASLDEFLCYNKNGTRVLALPSKLGNPPALNRFTVSFKGSGP